MDISSETLAAKFKSSGLTQETFCKEYGVPIERLRYYLYKKNKGRPGRKRNVTQKTKASSFISFNNSAATEIKQNAELPTAVTIIHGNFTVRQIITLISNLE